MHTDVESASPALCRLQLARELKQHRLAAGLRNGQVVKRLLWSASKITRLESGDNVTVEPADVIALCDMYGVDGDARALLVNYAAVTKTKRDWWQSAEYRQVITPSFRAYLGLEAAASAMQNYESEFVPGLLQIEPYVRVIHRRAHEGLSEEEIDKLVQVRVTRQAALTRTNAPLKFSAIINEAVLRRRVGDADVMRAQMNHIVEMASLPSVRVQVLPYRAGAHPGMNGAFILLRFRDNGPKPIIYLENLADALVNRREEDVERYEDAFTDLQSLAPGPEESLSIIKEAIKEWH
ncbi:helix-turn-helix domain-containing protein [Streptomyces sp. LP05-1]|uniref:Helix-turn-helix domain-containing protein n=1 Tax=Streptomyces pyxinae TaxID=2970734 RepID=A0ABT2CLZ1_9ACTN|nr:helix-turn-helix transcriptional regulator [Streptomyces sp. LP05-1]MCS0638340.1 helix-turn-helix domain-containing protein [Streptomyces sp. LP05-1]